MRSERCAVADVARSGRGPVAGKNSGWGDSLVFPLCKPGRSPRPLLRLEAGVRIACMPVLDIQYPELVMTSVVLGYQMGCHVCVLRMLGNGLGQRDEERATGEAGHVRGSLFRLLLKTQLFHVWNNVPQ